MTAPARGGGGGGEGGRGGGGGRAGGGGGGRGGGRGKAPDFGAPLPQTAQIHWRRRNFTAGPWGSFMGSHRGTPALLRVGVSGEGIKRWGIEGIRIGTSDRFGRGRGEFCILAAKS